MPPKVTRPVLKSYFPKGGKPTTAQFGSLIDSVFNFAEDTGLLGLNNYDPGLSYNTGDTVVEALIIYQANKPTGQGPFLPADWNRIAGGTSGSLLFKGPWDAFDDDPELASPTPIPPSGEFYVVSVAGNTSLSGITDWEVGDWAISAGTQWFKIDNSDFVTNAQNIGTGEGVFSAKVGTVINLRSITNLDGSVKLTPTIDSIDLAIEFDDSGTSLTRTWSAFYIDSQLATKEPAITPSGNGGDYWNGLKIFTDFGTSVRNTFLTGLDLTINQVISAGDNVIQAFGYLQKQISDLLTTVTSHIADTSNPHDVTKSQVGLSEVPNLKQNLAANNNPTTTDDSSLGYAIGSTWINVPSRKSFICVNAGVGVASWIETTNIPLPVFGNNYNLVEALTETSTLSTTFQTKITLSTGALTGTYRVQWSCVTRNDKKRGEYQLYNATDGIVIGSVLSWEASDLNEKMSLGGIATIVLSGSGKDLSIQFRALDPSVSNTQYISNARIESFRTN